jgi:hypothetical protein
MDSSFSEEEKTRLFINGGGGVIEVVHLVA